MKVYGWQGCRNECPPEANGSRQTREIVCAASMAAAARAAGVKRPSQLFNLSETGNKEEIAIARSHPGAVFWRPLDGREFRRAKEEKPSETRTGRRIRKRHFNRI